MIREERDGNKQKSQNNLQNSVFTHTCPQLCTRLLFGLLLPHIKAQPTCSLSVGARTALRLILCLTSINRTSGGDLKALCKCKNNIQKLPMKKIANSRDLPIFRAKYSNLISLRGRGGLNAVFKNFQVLNSRTFVFQQDFLLQISPTKRWLKHASICMKTDFASATSW